jgi:predicted DNA-binding protein (UPF0251 family)
VQLTQVEMARRISVSREKLNRKLAALRDDVGTTFCQSACSAHGS